MVNYNASNYVVNIWVELIFIQKHGSTLHIQKALGFRSHHFKFSVGKQKHNILTHQDNCRQLIGCFWVYSLMSHTLRKKTLLEWELGKTRSNYPRTNYFKSIRIIDQHRFQTGAISKSSHYFITDTITKPQNSYIYNHIHIYYLFLVSAALQISRSIEDRDVYSGFYLKKKKT